jgi:ATP-dependent DNA ligase
MPRLNPVRRKPELPPAPSDRASWRPQAFGHKRARAIADPIVEPGWSGVRVLAHAGRNPDGSTYATLSDEQGIDCTAEFADLAEAIAAANLGDEIVVDGWLTVQPTQPGEGVSLPLLETPGQGQLLAQMFGGGRARQAKPSRLLDPARPVAFVAVDLLLVDGSSLIEVPLLERKRLLDSALQVGELIRITPYVRPPIGSLADTWRAVGFREMVYKPANGRYLPAGEPSDWAIALIATR